MTNKEYKVGARTFAEEDFKNPPPLEEMSIEYKIAYAHWADANGLTIKFKNRREFDEWLRKKLRGRG